VFLESAIVVESLVYNADGDHGVDQIVVHRDFIKSCKNKRDAVTQSKDTHEFCDISEGSEKKDHAEKEKEMVVASEHVRCSKNHVSEIST